MTPRGGEDDPARRRQAACAPARARRPARPDQADRRRQSPWQSEATRCRRGLKIGVVPACISPYVIKRVGEGRAREFFLTGERLTSERALTAGLVNRAVPDDLLDATVNGLVESLLSSGPEAIKVCKQLLQTVPQQSVDDFKEYTARVIADLRQSPEGQEGMDAFLNKRKPKWVAEE